MTISAVILPPTCELMHNCTRRQARAILTAYEWCGIVIGALTVLWLAWWAVWEWLDRHRDRPW